MKPDSLPILAVVFSAFFWVVDSFIDTFIFDEGETLSESFFSPEPVELWMRILVIVLLVSFSFYTRYLLTQQTNISKELDQYKNHLEKTVSLRTQELKDEIEIRKLTETALREIATTDPLTLLFNRRKFSEVAEYEIDRESRYRSGLSLIMCDIDEFKKVNDKYGHKVGDEVLKTFAKILQGSTRKSDVVARWGGEEFVVLISNTDPKLAPDIADKLRTSIEQTDFKIVGKVTASFGVAFFEENDNEETLISRVDQALYQAKGNGRNCVEVNTGTLVV